MQIGIIGLGRMGGNISRRPMKAGRLGGLLQPGDILRSFGVVKAAQAQGDLAVLVERGRRALRVHLTNVDAGLKELSRAVDAALQQGIDN